jgi:hypothetical protein
MSAAKRKRGYSRAFTPRTTRRVVLTIGRVPPTLLVAVRAKARREGTSVRALVLGLLSDWIAAPAAEGSPHENR